MSELAEQSKWQLYFFTYMTYYFTIIRGKIKQIACLQNQQLFLDRVSNQKESNAFGVLKSCLIEH